METNPRESLLKERIASILFESAVWRNRDATQPLKEVCQQLATEVIAELTVDVIVSLCEALALDSIAEAQDE